MKRQIPFVILLLAFSSCQFFETEKVSSEAIYQEEVSAIDWNDITRYPKFTGCEENLDKAAQRDCFAKSLQESIITPGMLAALQSLPIEQDTIWLHFQVADDKLVTLQSAEIDSIILLRLPNFQTELRQSVESLELEAPAYKSGIPVTCRFSLPIIIESEDL